MTKINYDTAIKERVDADPRGPTTSRKTLELFFAQRAPNAHIAGGSDCQEHGSLTAKTHVLWRRTADADGKVSAQTCGQTPYERLRVCLVSWRHPLAMIQRAVEGQSRFDLDRQSTEGKADPSISAMRDTGEVYQCNVDPWEGSNLHLPCH